MTEDNKKASNKKVDNATKNTETYLEPNNSVLLKTSFFQKNNP